MGFKDQELSVNYNAHNVVFGVGYHF
jgi:hypothetical protein